MVIYLPTPYHLSSSSSMREGNTSILFTTTYALPNTYCMAHSRKHSTFLTNSRMKEQGTKRDIPIVLSLICQCLDIILLSFHRVSGYSRVPNTSIVSREESFGKYYLLPCSPYNMLCLKQVVYKDLESIHFFPSSLPPPQSSSHISPGLNWTTDISLSMIY